MRLIEYMPWDWLGICHETDWVYAMRLIENMPWDRLSICHETTRVYAVRLIEYMPWDWLSICHETDWVYAMGLIEYMPWDWLSMCHETDWVYAMRLTLYWRPCSQSTACLFWLDNFKCIWPVHFGVMQHANKGWLFLLKIRFVVYIWRYLEIDI